MPIAMRWMVTLVAYVASLLPIIVCPIGGDDFRDPFVMSLNTGNTWGSTFNYGLFELAPNHFGRLGMGAISTFNFAWLEVDRVLGLDHRTYYFATRALLYGLLAASLTSYIRRFSGGTRTLLADFTWTCLTVSATFQVHSLWSNDPVTGYIAIALPAVCLALVALIAVDRALAVEAHSTLFIGMAWIVCAVFYYEMNVALLPAVAVLAYMRRGSQAVYSRQQWITVAVLTGIPALLVVIARVASSASAAMYGGTAWGSWSRFGPSWLRGLASGLPGASWPLAADKASLAVVSKPLLAVCTCGLVVLIAAAFRSGGAHYATPVWKVGGITLITYAVAATGLQTATAKYQDEIRQIGHVYLFYAASASAVVVLAHSQMARLTSRRSFTSLVAVAVVACFAFSQQFVNVAVVSRMYQLHESEDRLVEVFRSSSQPSQRCMAWRAYAAENPRISSETEIGQGIQYAYKRTFGQEWCPGEPPQ